MSCESYLRSFLFIDGFERGLRCSKENEPNRTRGVSTYEAPGKEREVSEHTRHLEEKEDGFRFAVPHRTLTPATATAPARPTGTCREATFCSTTISRIISLRTALDGVRHVVVRLLMDSCRGHGTACRWSMMTPAPCDSTALPRHLSVCPFPLSPSCAEHAHLLTASPGGCASRICLVLFAAFKFFQQQAARRSLILPPKRATFLPCVRASTADCSTTILFAWLRLAYMPSCLRTTLEVASCGVDKPRQS
jgi:hypothetical protein